MTPWRRIRTIVGWAAVVCLIAYVPFVAYGYIFVGFSDADAELDSDDVDPVFQVLFWFLFTSPVIGGIIGLVRALRHTTTGTKVAWSAIGLVLIVISWFVLAYAGIALLFALPGVD